MKIFIFLILIVSCSKNPEKIASLRKASVSKLSDSKKVKGFADLHIHMFAQYAFGGMWFEGGIEDNSSSEIYKSCAEETQTPLKSIWSKIEDPYFQAFFKYGECLSAPYNSPRWDAVGFQQVWINSLKQAHEKGLTLMVLSLVNNETLCEALKKFRTARYPCDDMLSVDLQLAAFNKFQVANSSWVAVAKTPAEARSIIDEGKLAVVLGIEVSNLFGDMDWKTQFEKYFELGIRTLIPTHLYDNRFGGAALQSKALYLGNWLKNRRKGFTPSCFEIDEVELKNDYMSRSVETNKRGLTQEGRELLELMIDKKMLVDLAHMSTVMIKEALSIAKAKNSSVYVSHGHFKEVMMPPRGEFEKSTPYELAVEIKNRGGVFGLRTSHEFTHQYLGSGVSNDCQGSTKSFAQAYTWGIKEVGIPVIFGSDLNGFIPQTRPRFGREIEGCETPKATGVAFDKTGLGKISQLSDFIIDLKNLGVDTQYLENSSEYFIQSWEGKLIP
jgi:microsomal dipeptidase-like Zn-dependent dipeptidase